MSLCHQSREEESLLRGRLLQEKLHIRERRVAVGDLPRLRAIPVVIAAQVGRLGEEVREEGTSYSRQLIWLWLRRRCHQEPSGCIPHAG